MNYELLDWVHLSVFRAWKYYYGDGEWREPVKVFLGMVPGDGSRVHYEHADDLVPGEQIVSESEISASCETLAVAHKLVEGVTCLG